MRVWGVIKDASGGSDARASPPAQHRTAVPAPMEVIKRVCARVSCSRMQVPQQCI